MNGLDLLLHRRSVSRLAAPAPAGAALAAILQAGARAPDHGGLRPWRFFVIVDDGLVRFSQLLAHAAEQAGFDEKMRHKAAQAPFRAPMVIAVVAHCQSHSKVPHREQWLSAGCAVMAMQMAAQAQGFGGIWRSGALLESPLVREGFACRQQDQLVGFLYLGTPQVAVEKVAPADLAPLVRYF